MSRIGAKGLFLSIIFIYDIVVRYKNGLILEFGLQESFSIPERHTLAPRIGAARPTFARSHDAVQSACLRPDAHGMAHALQLRRKPLEPRALLEVSRTIAAAH